MSNMTPGPSVILSRVGVAAEMEKYRFHSREHDCVNPNTQWNAVHVKRRMGVTQKFRI